MSPARPSADDLYERAVALVLADQKASTSYLQRRLGVGYDRAADLIERIEREAVLSAPGHRAGAGPGSRHRVPARPLTSSFPGAVPRRPCPQDVPAGVPDCEARLGSALGSERSSRS